MTVGQSLEKLDKISALKENWNGNKAPKINPLAIEQAKKFIKDLGKLDPEIDYPEAFPLADGGVQVEWENNTRYIELEFHGTETVQLFHEWKTEDDGVNQIKMPLKEEKLTETYQALQKLDETEE